MHFEKYCGTIAKLLWTLIGFNILIDRCPRYAVIMRYAEGGKEMAVLKVILIVIEAIVSVGLIVVILMQSGKESGLSGAIAGNSESYMNKGNRVGLDKILSTATKWIALVWVAVTLALCLL